MISNQCGKKYNIELPESTMEDVVTWFDLMESKGILASSLIELVYEYIERRYPFNSIADSTEKDFEETQYNLFEINDFFNSLYDCSGSNTECFEEKIINKKESKKMFYI